MSFFIADISPEKIVIVGRAEGENGLIGDLMEDILPNEYFFNLSFDQLIELGLGEIKTEIVMINQPQEEPQTQ